MKRIFLLSFLIITFTVGAQDFYSSGDCKASFKFAVNPNIYTFAPATAIDFYDISEGEVIAWFWDFGDNNTSTEQNPMFIFNHPQGGPNVKISPYRTVRLTILTADSCKSTTSQTINIMDVPGNEPQNCVAIFKYYESARDTNARTVTFNTTNYSKGEDLSYFWQLGNGLTSTEQEPSVAFSMDQREYEVCLTVMGADSCTSTYCDVVYIENPDIHPPKCDVAFGFERKDILMGPLPAVLINFFYKSYPEAKEWYWDFGDGETSNEPNPSHIFTQMPVDSVLGDPNPFREVCLTVITTNDCKVSYCEKINVFDFIPPPPEPAICEAVFKYNEMTRDSLAGTATIRFDNYSEGKELSYIWQFGNGSESTEKDPVVTFKTGQSEYKVCLTVNGGDSCSSMMCQTVYLNHQVEPECKVNFDFDRKDILMTPLPSAVFDFYYKSDPEAIEWFWDFGDGTTSNEAKPTHVYIMPFMSDSMKVMYNPFRTVCLTIKTVNDCKISTCKTIQVFDFNPQPDPEPEKCEVYFKYYQPDDIFSIPEVVPIQLVDVSEGEVISRLWQFEDGTTSTEKEPLVSFNIFQPIHEVCLTVTFADSCTNTFCDAVYVHGGIIDTIVVDQVCPYSIKVEGGFPIQMSSCAGWASAKVYFENELAEPDFISWSTGDTLSKVQGLCPTQTYTVKALMPDGWAVYSNFIFNSDGSITIVNPILPVMLVNWRLSGDREKMYVRPDVSEGMKVEWRLCDGTIVEADSIQLDDINCGGNMSNMIVKDSLGNVVYSENISLKGSVTGVEDLENKPTVKLWPNPVSSRLNIRYSGEYQSEIKVEVCDIMGKQVSVEKYFNISDGYEFNIDIESLKQGIYICRISTFGKTLAAEKFSRR